MSIHGREVQAARAMTLCCALLFSLLTVPRAAAPSFFDDLVADLVAKIAAAVATADRVHVAFAGERSLEPSGGPHLEADIAQRLAARGIRIVDNAAGAAVVTVACSTNRRERVCAAEVRRAEASQLLIATGGFDRDAGPVEPPMILEMRHVFSQAAPILDVALAGDRLVVLDPATMTLYQRSGAVWQKRRAQPIVSSRVWPRDVRGRLRLAGAAVEAFLPGAVCRATLESFAVSCADERQPWPLAIDNTGIAGGRNYFTTPEGLAFYGFAPLESDAGARWLLVADRSRLVLLDEARRALEPAVGTGDDVAGVTTCAPGAFVLVSSRAPGGDGRDTIRLFRVLERRLVPAASPLLLPGALTALWAAPGSSTATVVVRDASARERYDALQIDVACGR